MKQQRNCLNCANNNLGTSIDDISPECWSCSSSLHLGGPELPKWIPILSSPDMTEQKPTGALAVQVGGAHYKDTAIQPIVYIHANELGFCEGNVVKYITRWRDKGGKQDLEKVKHYVDLLIDLEGLK